jgi:Thioesterase-like superfamily
VGRRAERGPAAAGGLASAALAEAFYIPAGDGFESTELTRGPWDPRSQHAGPPAALLGRALERCEPREGAVLGRVTVDILRPVPIARLRTEARVVRPGRSVELLEASLRSDEGEVMRALAWRLAGSPAQLPELPPDPGPPGPAEGEAKPFFGTGQEVGYHTAMEYRFVRGGFREIGPATVWLRMRQPLVAGEEPSPLQRVLTAADSGNGVSAALDYHEWMFINTDLSVHLLRPAVGEWICLDSATFPDAGGVGLSDTALWDERGRLGRAAQTLLVRRRA